MPAHDFAGLGQLPLFALLGVGCGLLAVVITRGLFVVEHGYRRLPVAEFWHPVDRRLGVRARRPRSCPGRSASATTPSTTCSTDVSPPAPSPPWLVAKLVAWWLALGSGTSGGTLAPILLISACFGSLVGAGVDHVFPGLGIAPGAFAVVAMAATFGAATRATFAAIVFVFELTRDYDAHPAADAGHRRRRPRGPGTARRDADDREAHPPGRPGPRHYEPDVFQTTTVAAVMRPPADGRLPAGASVRPTDVLADVLTHFADDEVHDIPVVDDGRLVGVCNRHDLLTARLALLDHERPEPGWLARRTT